MAALVTIIAIGLAFVIAAPFALSSQDLVDWASSPTGLDLSIGWSLYVFVALDVAAAVCVLFVVYAAWRGESAGIFGLLVWAFAATSAFANYQHAQTTAARDDNWFFPAMSLAGPFLLEATTRRIRRWVRSSAGRYEHPLPHFRMARWLPGVAFRETTRALKLAITEGYSRPEDAIAAARIFRGVPTGKQPEKTPDNRPDETVPEKPPVVDRSPEPEPVVPEPVEPVDRSKPETTGPVDQEPEEKPEPVNPPARKALDPDRLEDAYRQYAAARLATPPHRMTESELAPVLDVSTDRARAIRRTKLDPRFLEEHPEARLRSTS